MNNNAWKHLGETLRLIALGQLAGVGYKAIIVGAIDWPIFSVSVLTAIVLVIASTFCMTRVSEKPS